MQYNSLLKILSLGVLVMQTLLYYSVHCCHNQPKVGNDFFELISSSDTAEKELSSKTKVVFM